MSILEKIVEYKKTEIPSSPEVLENLPKAERDFFAALEGSGNVIGEIKPASPLKGRVLPKDFNPAEFAAAYEKAGVSAISVLTDSYFFGGSFENLQTAKQATSVVPILCKDFILSEKQIRLARKYGADSFLLIVKILSVEELKNLISAGRNYNMEPLVEITDNEDLQKVLQTDAKIIGINNRDLRDFSVDLSRTLRLAKQIPKNRLIISLSGFYGADIRLVKGACNGVLVGSGIGAELRMNNEEFRMKLNSRRMTKKDEEIIPKILMQSNNEELRTQGDEARNMNQEARNEKSYPPPFYKRGRKGDFYTGILQKVLSQFIKPKPLVKFCGVRTEADFEMAKKMQVPLLGLNFVLTSKRCISEKVLNDICMRDRGNMRLAGVFMDQSRNYVQNICSKYRLDFAQLSGSENPDDFADFPVPIFKSISIIDDDSHLSQMEIWHDAADIFLFDGKNPGSGDSWVDTYGDEFQRQNIQKPFLVAGGVTPENAKRFLEITNADGVDTASGIEDESGKWDFEKMTVLMRNPQLGVRQFLH